MSKKYLNRFAAAGLVLSLCAGMVPVHAEEETEDAAFTVEKLSNPDHGQREADGLTVGGDREVGYLWSIAERGDDLYIGTWHNTVGVVIQVYLESALVASGAMDSETVWDAVDVVTNGEVPHPTKESGGSIVKVNKDTLEQTVIYEAPYGVSFRHVVKYEDDLYFATYVGAAAEPASIVKVDENDVVTTVYTTGEGASVRANAVYEGDLYFAGTDTSYELFSEEDAGAVRLAVLRKDQEDDTVWHRVADYRDFGEYPYDGFVGAAAGSPFWDMISFGGYLYATIPNTNGFVIYRGHPAEGEEAANEYGWYWEEVAGRHNGLNNLGLHDYEPDGYVEGNSGYSSVVGALGSFKGHLYAYDIDHTISAELQGIKGMLAMMMGMMNGDFHLDLSTYITPLYNSLNHPQRLWRMDNETGQFEEMYGFTELMEGTTNEYVWKSMDYDGYFYVSTMDSAVIYNYLTRVSNGSLFRMTAEEWEEQLNYITKLIQKLTAKDDEGEGNEYLEAFTEEMKTLQEMMLEINEMDVNEETIRAFLEQYSDFLANLLNASEDLKEDLENGLNQDDAALVRMAVQRENGFSLMDEGDEETEPSINWEEINARLAEILAALFGTIDDLTNRLKEIYNSIDFAGMQMYVEVSNKIRKDTWGFDIVRSRDGVNWETVTNDGFGDRYNYGGLRFVPTDKGMYITTANPFYGGQLHLLKTDNQIVDEEVYTVTLGADQTVEPGSETALTFETDADEVTLRDILVDGVKVELDSYTATDESMTLIKEYVRDLEEGEHTIRFRFEDGYAETTLTVAEKEPEPTEEPELYTGFKDGEGNEIEMYDGSDIYWFENGKQQGQYGDPQNIWDTQYSKIERGREIYDPHSDNWYWLDANNNGAVARDKEVWLQYIYATETIGDTPGKWVRYDHYGRMIKGWYACDEGFYYYDKMTGAMCKGKHVIDGKEYFFDELTGIMQ